MNPRNPFAVSDIWTSRLQLTDSAFGEVPLLGPPRDEQDAIVDFLDRKLADIDRFVATKESLINLLEAQKSLNVSKVIAEGLAAGVPMQTVALPWLHAVPAHWVQT